MYDVHYIISIIHTYILIIFIKTQNTLKIIITKLLFTLVL